MLSAIIENKETKEDEYLYLKGDNNNLTYYGYNIQNGDIKPVDKNIISKVYDLLRVHENCIYIGDYLDYKVYLDRENNIKHYLKNGVEDFLMLYKNNGEDLNLYNNSDDKENINSNSKKFKIGNFNIKLSKRFVTILPAILISLNITGCDYSKENINKIEYSTSNVDIFNSSSSINSTEYDIPNVDIFNPENSTISVEEAMELINSSQIPFGKRKNIGANLLEDVFAYYKDTNMEYIIKSRLENLHIEAYDENMYKDGNISINTFGYYDELTPNVIHIREDYIKADLDDGIFFHEFVHLLQSNNCEYRFLKETTAEIISDEYLHSAGIGNYWGNVINTKILMNIVGPKAVWETVFGGNDTNLINIINSNLSEQESNELISYLKQDPEKLLENNNYSYSRMYELLANLYRNMNSTDIENDKNIFDSEGVLIDRVYFNERRMEEQFQLQMHPEAQNISNYDPETSNLNSEEAISLIDSSSLPLGKKIGISEFLLRDVFGYYKGTEMENIIKSRLENLHIEAYDENTYKDGNISINTFGYYDELTPNVIHIREDYIKEDSDDGIFFHEFIHLLQSNNCEYKFLKETTAEIISDEYFHSGGLGTYWSKVLDTEILMNIVGPKVVWETVFSGNDTNLVNVIKSNLSEQESNELISYLKQDPKELEKIENSNLRISELLANLYKNMNSTDIENDKNIFDSDGKLINKVYFNSNYEIKKQPETKISTIKEIFPDQTIRSNDNNMIR